MMRKTEKIKGRYANRFWELWGIRLFGGTMEEVLNIIGAWIDTVEDKPRWIATVNPEFVMKASKDREFMRILQGRTSLNIIDGVGLVWAKKVLSMKYQVLGIRRIIKAIKVGVEILRGGHREGVVPGADLMRELCVMAARKKWRVFFLGGWNDRAARAARNLKFKIQNFQCDWSPGEPEVTNDEVIRKINSFKPRLLFVAYGMGKQEEWIRNNLAKIETKLAMGVGRSFDYYSGDLPRAPAWVRRMGMEWLYSLIKEPRRWRRQMELIRFVWKVVV